MSLLPIEVFAQIAFHLPGEDYVVLSSLNKNLRKILPLYRTSSLPFNMTELQKEAYDELCQSKSMRIFLQRAPRTGISIVLLNYIAHELEINNGKQILVSCVPTEYEKWRKRLRSNFTSFVSISNYHRVPTARIILIKEPPTKILHIIKPSFVLMICPKSSGYHYRCANLDDTIKCIESSCSLYPCYANAERIVKRTILPFPTYPQEFISGMDEVKYRKLTMIGTTRSFIRWFKKRFSYTFFHGDQPGQAKAFKQCDKDAILFYGKDFIFKNVPSMVGPVIYVNAFNSHSGGSNKQIYKHMLPFYHTLLVSKKITHLYYINWDQWYGPGPDPDPTFRSQRKEASSFIILYDMMYRLFMITKDEMLSLKIKEILKNMFTPHEVIIEFSKNKISDYYNYLELSGKDYTREMIEVLMEKRKQY